MGSINIDNTGSGGAITLSSDGTSLLLGGSAVGGGGASAYTIDDKTADYTAVSGDLGKIIRFTVNSAVTLTLPTASSVGEGWYITVLSSGGNIVTVARTGSSDLFDGNQYNSGSASTFVSSGSSVTFVSDGSSAWHSLSENIYFYAEYNQNTGLFKPQATAKSAIAIGRSATASGTNSMALGSNSSFLGSVSAGSGSVALNGSYASGTNSFAAAIASNSSSYGATGANSIAMGQNAKATNGLSVGLGYGVNASAYGSLCVSYNSSTSGNYSSVLGGISSTASATKSSVVNGDTSLAGHTSSTAIGPYSTTRAQYAFAFGGQSFDAQGAGQSSIFNLVSDTTDATAEAMTTNKSAASTNNQVILPNNSAYAFHGTIVARQQAADGTACAAWKVEGLIRREGSAGTTVLVNSATTVLDNTPSWGMALSADTTNGGLAITVTGAASTDIRWVATIHTSEVTYA